MGAGNEFVIDQASGTMFLMTLQNDVLKISGEGVILAKTNIYFNKNTHIVLSVDKSKLLIVGLSTSLRAAFAVMSSYDLSNLFYVDLQDNSEVIRATTDSAGYWYVIGHLSVSGTN